MRNTSTPVQDLSVQCQAAMRYMRPVLISNICRSTRLIPDSIVGDPFKLITERMSKLEAVHLVYDNWLVGCCLLLSDDLKHSDAILILLKTVHIHRDLIEAEGKRKYKIQFARLLANSYAGLVNKEFKKLSINISDSVQKGASLAKPF